MKTFPPGVILAIGLTLVCQPIWAGCKSGNPDSCTQSDCNCCSANALCCQQQCKTVVRKKYCWDVECQDVCIPPVTLPACHLFGQDDGCASEYSNGRRPGFLQRLCAVLTDGRVRRVHKMKKKEYEIQERVPQWTVVRKSAAGCTSYCGDGCGSK